MKWGTQAYNSLHAWVRFKAGSASDHLCISCLAPAEDWATMSGEYQRNLAEFMPLCKLCHGWFDATSSVTERRRSQWREAARRHRGRVNA